MMENIVEGFKFDEAQYWSDIEQTKEEMKELYEDKVLVIQDLIQKRKMFNKVFDDLYNFMMRGFEVEEIRKFPIMYKFNNKESDIYSMEARHMITNLLFWKTMTYLDMEDDIDSSYYIDAKNINNGMIKTFIDQKIIIPFRHKIDTETLNKIIHDLLYRLAMVSNDFNMLMGMSISMETFIDVANKNPRFDEIIRTKVDPLAQPVEIETMLNNLMKEEIEILKTEENMLKPILCSGAGIKDQQLREFSINGGLKPDLSGNTVPVPINSNFLVGGLTNIINYYIDATGGRKALISNKCVMGSSGHFARLVKLLTTDIKLADVDNCGTVHPIALHITNGKMLSKLKGRWYRYQYDRKYRLLKGDEKHLIGQTLLFRDPTTCACGTSNKGELLVCRKCYGELSRVNEGISIGGFAATYISRPVSQNILSTKHLLTTVSEEIVFNDEFDRFFVLNSNQVQVNLDSTDNIEDYKLIIHAAYLNELEDFEDDEYNAYIYYFLLINKKTGEVIEIREERNKELFIAPDFYKYIKKRRKHGKKKEGENNDYYEIDLAKLESDPELMDLSHLFMIQIENNELTKPLYSIMHLLDRADRGVVPGEEPITTIDQLTQRFLELLIEAGIDAQGVHASVILMPLLRKVDNILERPNFRNYNEPYRMLTIKGALENSPSVEIGLSFQYLDRQLKSLNTYLKKSGSYMSPFYRKTLH